MEKQIDYVLVNYGMEEMAKRKHIASIVSKKYENWEKGFVDSFWSKVSYTKLDYKRESFQQ